MPSMPSILLKTQQPSPSLSSSPPFTQLRDAAHASRILAKPAPSQAHLSSNCVSEGPITELGLTWFNTNLSISPAPPSPIAMPISLSHADEVSQAIHSLTKLTGGLKRPRAADNDPRSNQLSMLCRDYFELFADADVTEQYCKSCKKAKPVHKFKYKPNSNKRNSTCAGCCDKKKTSYHDATSKARSKRLLIERSLRLQA